MFRIRNRNYFKCFLTEIGLILLTDALLTKENKTLQENKQVKQINQNNMKSKLKILVVFVVMFCASFIPESNHEFFGDWKCKGSNAKWDKDDYWSVKGCQYESVSHDPTWHWGTRHWVWLFAGITFSTWAVAEVIIEAHKKVK